LSGSNNFAIETGGKAKAGTRSDGPLQILCVQQGARAYTKLWARITDGGKHVGGGLRAESDFGDGQPTFKQGVRQRNGISDTLDGNNRDNAKACDKIKWFCHDRFSPDMAAVQPLAFMISLTKALLRGR
jgi:hypothetical protein